MIASEGEPGHRHPSLERATGRVDHGHVGPAAALAARVSRLGAVLMVVSCCNPNQYGRKSERVCLASLSNGDKFCYSVTPEHTAEFKLGDRSLVEIEDKVIEFEQMSAALDDSQRSKILELRKALDRTKSGLAWAGAAGDHTAFDTFARDLAHLKGETAAVQASVRVGFGLTRPSKLLYFQAGSFAKAGTAPPAMCAGDRILRALEEWVRKDSACKATGVTDGDWKQELLEASCVVENHPHGCEDRYVAWIWRENVKASESDYRLYGYSRLAKECPDGDTSSPTASATKVAGDKSEALFKFLGQCEGRP
jgi:hypothetical protein